MPLWLHFKAIQAGKGREREKINIIVPFCSDTTRNRKFQKNKKNTIMASFPGKIGWKRLRKRENKNYRSVPARRVTENSKKNSKN